MIASSHSILPQSTPSNLQNSLTAEALATEQSPVAVTMLSQTAIDEFALRFNASVIEMLTAHGAPNTSPLSKKLKAYSAVGVATVKTTSRFV